MKGLKHFHDFFLVSNKFLFFTVSAQLGNNFLFNNLKKKVKGFNSNFYLPSKNLMIKESKKSFITIFFYFLISI